MDEEKQYDDRTVQINVKDQNKEQNYWGTIFLSNEKGVNSLSLSKYEAKQVQEQLNKLLLN